MLISKFRFYLDIVKLGILTDQSKDLNKCDLLFICHDADRPLKLKGEAYAPLIDSIREDFEQRGFKCISVAHYGSKLTGKRAYGNPLSVNRKQLRYLIIGRLISLLRIDKVFKKPSFYKYLLKKINPRIVFTIGAPDQLCYEARLKDILTVEILHGIGYKFIPWGWDEKSTDYLPKAILSLDKVSSTSFSSLSKQGINILTIPNPFLKRFLPSRLYLLPNEWKMVIGKNNKKKILVSLNWGYWGDHGEFSEFADILSNGLFYEELADLIRDDLNVFWCFRLHPLQTTLKKYRNLRDFLDRFVKDNSNCEWIQSSSLPFPIVAAQCSGNIGMSSMSCYDAAAMGVPSLMLCPTIQPGGIHEDWFEDLENEGYVTKNIVDKKRLQNWVQAVEKIEPRLSNLIDEDSWENAVEWLLSESGLKSS